MPSAHSGARFKRIYYSNPKEVKVTFVSGCKLERVHAGGSSDHDIFKQLVRLSLHESGPLPEAACIQRKHLVRIFQLIHPGLYFARFGRVLPPRSLNTGLQLSQGNRRKKKLVIPQTANPRRDPTMRLGFAQFGDDVRVQQVSGHLNSTG